MTALRPRLPRRYAKPVLIAHGGMGDVYRATDERLGRTVAIKVLGERYASDDVFHARFRREAKTAASLSGEPYVIVIHDVGESDDGLPFIVMEYVPGGTVAERIAAGRVERDVALAWLAQAAEALDRARDRGVVHRDVKPANLLLASDGTIRVSDFGIARAADTDALTAVGTVLGSSGYMAPEQARGEESTPATDRYALACVAFELLTGRRPFERESMAAEAAAHATEPPPPVTELDPALPAALDDLFARALAKDPAERPASAAGMVGDLRDVLADPATTPTRVIAPGPVRTYHARPRRGLILGVAGALLAVGALVGWAMSGDDAFDASAVRPSVSVRTVTVAPPPPAETPPPPPPAPSPPPSSSTESGAQLNDRGFRLLQQRNPSAALPLLETAFDRLQGSGSRTEAYASYNLAVARFSLGRCDGVAELLDRSQAVQGYRTEIARLRREVDGRCDAGDGDESD